MKALVYGNGPSQHTPEGHTWNKKIGCNFASKNVDVSAITDYPVLRQAIRDKRLYWPVVVTERALRKVRRAKVAVEAVIPYLQLKSIHPSYGINSGQLAAIYAAQQHSEVHLVGFDSVFRDDLSSSTDALIQKDGDSLVHTHQLHLVWRQYWNYLFQLYDDVNFIFYDDRKHKFESRTDKLFPVPFR